jgi:hypothetical protein
MCILFKAISGLVVRMYAHTVDLTAMQRSSELCSLTRAAMTGQRRAWTNLQAHRSYHIIREHSIVNQSSMEPFFLNKCSKYFDVLYYLKIIIHGVSITISEEKNQTCSRRSLPTGVTSSESYLLG